MTVVVERDLIELAGRCEKATGPDEKLDEEIWAAIEPENYHPILIAPRFTGSLDSAVRAIPAGWFWGAAENPVSAKVWTEGNVAYWVPRFQVDTVPATPILALLVAILRARASMKGDG